MTTTAHADLEALHRHLDEHPDDQRVRRDLADHLDERGDPDGEALRWLAERGKWPRPPGPENLDLRATNWRWWRTATDAEQHCLPPPLRYRLGKGSAAAFYPTRREAEADLCRAFHEAKSAGWNPETS
jgi:hypothetical protein